MDALWRIMFRKVTNFGSLMAKTEIFYMDSLGMSIYTQKLVILHFRMFALSLCVILSF